MTTVDVGFHRLSLAYRLRNVVMNEVRESVVAEVVRTKPIVENDVAHLERSQT